jgi:hypothetical protein
MLKTWTKQLQGSLPLDIALPEHTDKGHREEGGEIISHLVLFRKFILKFQNLLLFLSFFLLKF